MKLNLGCGPTPLQGHVNVDRIPAPGVDMVLDLDKFPWPWRDGSVDAITSSHWLDHVADYGQTVLEMHRILKPGGVLSFRVPHFRFPLAVIHVHKQQFSVWTPQLICREIEYMWGGRKLFDLRWLRITTPFGMLDWLANLWPLGWDGLGLPIAEIDAGMVKHGRAK